LRSSGFVVVVVVVAAGALRVVLVQELRKRRATSTRVSSRTSCDSSRSSSSGCRDPTGKAEQRPIAAPLSTSMSGFEPTGKTPRFPPERKPATDCC
jgi:hypothetical protein